MQLTETATWAEIQAQPDIWQAWAGPLSSEAARTADWIARRGPQRIVLSGAGTSAFIGDALQGAQCGGVTLEAVASTDAVSCPQEHLRDPRHTLWVQFGRSGDSPESVGLLDLLDAHRPGDDRLHITCNPDGALATRPAPGPGEARVIALPPVTHDRGFAMTSSYSTMLLTALACLTGWDPAGLPGLAAQARDVLDAVPDLPRPARAVFLGAGSLTAVARESALKVLELTAGRTLTQWDSPMGYRHGPKAAMEDGAHVVVLLHPDPHTAQYDRDAVAEIRTQFPAARLTTVGPGGDIAFAGTGDARADAVLYVLPAQVMAARWSAALGLAVDDPFQGRALSRVVAGVPLYPWQP